MRRFTSWLATIGTAGLLAAGGCRDLGAGGTGERVVSRDRLRDVTAVELDALPSVGTAATQPFVLSTTQPTAVLTEEPISLTQVRQWALENNLQLKVDLLEPTIARQFVGEEQARFEALFTTTASYNNSDTPFLATQPDGSRVIRGSQNETWSVVPGIVFPLITGGRVQVRTPVSESETSGGRIDLNTGLPTSSREWNSDFDVSVSQPLLRGGGVDANLASIRIAFYQFQQAEARTKLRVITVLADADRQFWRLDGALKLLDVQRRRYASAEDQLRRARRRLEVGTGVEADVLTAEAAVADAASAIVVAESAVRTELRELKRVVNRPDIDLNSAVLLRPATQPRFLAARLDADALAEQAVRDRMEILETELQMLREAVSVGLARNDLLPLLNFEYRYTINGLGETRSDAFDLLTDNDFADHRVGLSVEIPIGNQAARSRLRRALAQRQQALATRVLREQNVRAEVYLSVQNLEQTWQAILAARQRVFAESRVLESEVRKFERGESDSEDVRLARDRLTQAQEQEVRAVRDYQISQIDVAFATGTLLGASNVAWTPLDVK
jgi:outer membrane protein TolC